MELLIITGPPYSGKGTQCELLKKELNYQHISTGDRCRYEKEQKTAIGLQLDHYQKKGDLVPDDIMKELFSLILDENIKSKGVILDGYPRTKNQVDSLIELTKEKNIQVSKVLNVEVPKETLLIRAKKRAETSDREDDKNPETHLRRIRIFEEETLPAIEYMKSTFEVANFNGLGSIEEISQNIKASL
ncbi:MAG: nucleoside monophosphate kinase [Flavobacteriaceae bacterium]